MVYIFIFFSGDQVLPDRKNDNILWWIAATMEIVFLIRKEKKQWAEERRHMEEEVE